MIKLRKLTAVLAAVSIIFNVAVFSSGAEYELGDVNGDGALTAADAALTLQYVLNPSAANLDDDAVARAKVLGGDSVTAADAAAILQKVLNDSYVFPAVDDDVTSGGADDVTSGTSAEATTETTTKTTTTTTTTTTTETTTETTTIEYPVVVNGVTYYIGQSADSLPEATRVETGVDGYTWYVYADDYSNYIKVGVANDAVQNIFTTADGFEVAGYTDGMIPDEKTDNVSVALSSTITITLYYDYASGVGDGNLYGVTLKSSKYRVSRNFNDETIETTNNQIFDITNAIRVKYGYAELYKLDELSEVAQAYAEYMAENSYFGHADLDGNRVGARLTAKGIAWYTCSENIAEGYVSAETVMNGWMNSSGHRTNILNADMEYLGVGTAYNSSDALRAYTRNVQNFCTLF